MNQLSKLPSSVITLLFLGAVVPLLLVGCSAGAQPLPENSPPQTPTLPTEAAAPVTDTSTEATSSSADPNKSPAQGEKNYLDIGFTLMDTELHGALDGFYDADTLISMYGKPERSTEPVVWGADGLVHQSWSYPSKGLAFDLVKDDSGVFKADALTITKPSALKTLRGIGIGSSRKEVMKAYGKEIDPKETDSESDRIVAGTVYGGVIFTLNSNKVTSIFIGAAAE